MKQAASILIILFLGISNLFGQTWKQKLNEARKDYQLGNYGESYKKYEQAKSIAPENVDFSKEIGQAAYKAENFEKAQEYFSVSTESEKKKKVSPDQFHNLGNAQMRSKKYSDAIESYKKALRQNPNDSETRYNLSEAIRKNRDLEKKNPPPSDNQNQKNPNDNKPKDPTPKKNQQQGDIPKRAVDRMLDKLSKKEADTKKKINNRTNQDQSNSKSQKDW